jgi:hypothetical protein
LPRLSREYHGDHRRSAVPTATTSRSSRPHSTPRRKKAAAAIRRSADPSQALTDPRRIAEKIVADWFAGLLESTDGFVNPSHDEAVIDAVANALEAQHVGLHGPIDPDSGIMEMLEREAGYLVGVQVGLRLRGAR